ncbi:MAG TPA: N-acetyl-gamma-glutamyl-phosphate reductase, partial [Bryobacteraceae bacterium]
MGIAGFRGYAGAELVRILSRHSGVEVVLLEHRGDTESRPVPLGQKLPKTLPATIEAISKEKISLVFLATPVEVAMELAPSLLEAGIKVVDLGAAFRLRDNETFSRWYPERHTAPEFFREAVYGLPEFYREDIPGARLLANPGC